MMGSLSLTTLINFVNSLLSIGIAVTAFALLIYIIRYNWRSPVARAFCVMLTVRHDRLDGRCRHVSRH